MEHWKLLPSPETVTHKEIGKWVERTSDGHSEFLQHHRSTAGSPGPKESKNISVNLGNVVNLKSRTVNKNNYIHNEGVDILAYFHKIS